MPHFGLICPPVTGHVNPLAAVGRALIRRGHRATMFHLGDLEPKARAEGLGFRAIGLEHSEPGAVAASVERLSRLSGLASLKFAIQCSCWAADLILKFGPEDIRSAGVDVLLVDQNEPAGGSVAEHLKIPFVSVCTSLPLNREPLIPPAFAGWDYSNSVFAAMRNWAGYAVADRLVAPIQATLNRYRVPWNLQPLTNPNDSFSELAQMAQMPREFDFPRKQLPSTFHYLGPWFDHASPEIPFPFERLDGRPLIYGSLGTLQRKDSHYFSLIAEACAGLEAQLVLSLGGHTEQTPRDLPGNPIVVNYAPQLELLERAALTITHSGMNTTQQSLYFGVPMVAIPLAHDQPAIAARVARTGAGIVIPPKRLTATRLREAVSQALPVDSAAREHARRLRDAARRAGGVEAAADIAERAVKAHLN